jgi:hypothetical protein
MYSTSCRVCLHAGSVHVRFVVDKAAVARTSSSQSTSVSPVTIRTPMLHSHIPPDTGVKYKTSLFSSEISKFRLLTSDSAELHKAACRDAHGRPLLQMPQCHFMYSNTTAEHSIATDIQTYLSPKAAVYVSVGHIKLVYDLRKIPTLHSIFPSLLSVCLIALLFVLLAK